MEKKRNKTESVKCVMKSIIHRVQRYRFYNNKTTLFYILDFSRKLKEFLDSSQNQMQTM